MLPNIMTISKKVHLPILNKDVTVNAFCIAEEKILLLNSQSPKEEIETVILDLIKSKTEDIVVESLTTIDIVVLFLNIIDISKNGVTKELTYKCNNVLENGEICGEHINVSVNLMNYEITHDIKSKLIKINESTAFEVTVPSYREIQKLLKYKENNGDYITHLYSKMICAVYHNDEVYTDFTDDEIYDWCMKLPSSVIEEFDEYIESLPELKLEYTVTCPKCGVTDKYIVRDFVDFFTFSIQA